MIQTYNSLGEIKKAPPGPGLIFIYPHTVAGMEWGVGRSRHNHQGDLEVATLALFPDLGVAQRFAQHERIRLAH